METALKLQTSYNDSRNLSVIENHLCFLAKDKRCHIQIAGDRHTREQSYRLMYQIYSAKGYGKPHCSELWFSLYELLPSAITIVAKHQGEAVASLTLGIDSAVGVPADDAFSGELDDMRASGHRIAEVFSLGVREDLRHSEIVLGKLISMTYLVGRYIAGLNHLVITVVPSHAAFYRRKLHFEPISKVGFHKKTGVECVLLAHPLNAFDSASDHLRKRTMNRYYVPKDSEAEVISRLKKMIQPMSSGELNHFLNIRPEIRQNATAEQWALLNFLQERPLR